jgi:mono/diheme cytochrome c family protein
MILCIREFLNYRTADKIRAVLRKALLALSAIAAIAPPVRAADAVATYYQDVRPILQANCQTCHRRSADGNSGLVAPMPLTTYAETRPWARAIARQVESRQMPPWFAAEPKGVFANERTLTETEIAIILAWVKAGAPAGVETLSHPAPPALPAPPAVHALPAPPVNGSGWSLGKPDLVVKMPQPYLMPDDAYDAGATFFLTLTETDLPADVWMRGWEIRPGTDGAVVHHMCVGVLAPGEAPRPSGDQPGQLGCIAAGAEAAMLPARFGRPIAKGSTVWFNMHYHKQPGPGTAASNQAEIGFFLAKGPAPYVVRSDAIGNYGFEIPPNRSNYRVGGGRMLDKDTWMLALWPHAHLRATAARYTATYPDGRREVLLDVPRYDQSWQVTYNYRQPKLLPKGTMLDVSFWYDNTHERAARRDFDADHEVRVGPRTDDEMMLGFISYAELDPQSDLLQCNTALPSSR